MKIFRFEQPTNEEIKELDNHLNKVRVFPLNVPDFIDLKLEQISETVFEIRVKNKLTREGIIRDFNIVHGLSDARDFIKVDTLIEQMVSKVDHNPK